MPNSFIKDPQAKKDYLFDWNGPASLGGPRLAVGETISTSSFTVDSGLVTDTPAPSNTTTTATIWLSGGTAFQDYKVVNHITTSAGRADDWTMVIMVRDR